MLLFEKLRLNRGLQWCVIHLRYLLGVAFIPSGMVKVLGEPFTQLSPSEPIGYFFDAMLKSGYYYNFIGLAQVTAGFLLMTQRLASLGAIVYACLIANIWTLTLSLHFKGTWVITSLMLLAVLGLLIWDFEKYKSIFSYNKASTMKIYPDPSRYWQILGLIYFTGFTVSCFFTAQQTIINIILGFLVALFVASNIYAYQKKRHVFVLLENE